MFPHPRILALLVVCLAMPACATSRAGKKGEEANAAEKTEAAPVPPPNVRFVGTISMVNEELGFVLIDSPEALAAGTKLKAFSPQTYRETGNLSVNPEQSYPFFTAEITGGEPHPGDRVGKPQ
jgi:hypothetical protein